MFLAIFKIFFCNRPNSLLSFGGPQHSDALPFTYDQYVVLELADKLYDFVTVCFCANPWIFNQINNFSKLPTPGIEPLTLGLQSQRSTSTPWGTHTLWCYIRSKSLSNDYEKLIKIGITIPFDLRLEGVRRLRSCIVFEGTIKVCPAGTENRFLLRLDFRYTQSPPIRNSDQSCDGSVS